MFAKTAVRSDPRLVLAVYQSEEHADEARKQAGRARFGGPAAIHCAEDGRIRIHAGHGYWTRVMAALAVALAAGATSRALGAPFPVVAASLAAGFLVGWAGAVWLGVGISRHILRRYARFVLPGESLLILRGREERVEHVVALLRHISHPSIFVVRPRGRFRSGETRKLRIEPVGTTGLGEHAAALAREHELAPTLRSTSLLPLLRTTETTIEETRAVLTEAARLDHGLSHAAEWLLDNAYLIRSHIAEIRHNLPDDHHRILPVFRDRNGGRRPRIYHLAVELIDRTGLRATPEGIVAFLDTYQRHAPLLVAELWVLPLMLRLVLLERLAGLSEVASRRQHHKELADFWADRLLSAAHRRAEHFDRILAELDRDPPVLTSHFIARLGEHLYKDEVALAPLQKWIENKTDVPLSEIILREHSEESNDLALVASAIGSLRRLSQLDYPKIVEAVSVLEAVLRGDPSGVHTRSDFATRDRCRRVVEACSRQSDMPEWEVARLAVELAECAPAGGRERSVAYYLLDRGLVELEKRVRRRAGWRLRGQRFVSNHPAFSYLGSLSALTAAIVGAFALSVREAGVTSPGLVFVLGVLALLPASELATYLLQTLWTWIIPPRVLPKLSFEDGVPDECRTLVVVPMMLLTPDSIRGEIEKLEVRYLANADPNIFFSLLSDFTDAAEPEMPEDDDLLGLAIKGIERLNAEYGEGRFVLFHRPRVWCESEGQWIGWERKRGKLEELNRLLNGEEIRGFVHAGSLPDRIRYVITLDADTQLPHGSAERLIATIAYPLNRIELTEDERDRIRGYGIIQPRVSITLPSATASRFSRLFTDARGTDPYCRAVSDVYQDLFGEAIYHGKAIYDVRAFYKVLDRRFPDQRLLSHDLIEGAHVGVGLATDVELFEQFPYDYASYSKRQHRWIRGDWQIASWILSRVPSGKPGTSVQNPLSPINRWKIADNLRRSLLPPVALTLLLVSWALEAAPLAGSVLLALMLLIPLAVQLLSRMVQRWQGDTWAWREAGSDLNRAVVVAAFLPHQTYVALDAVVRAMYRLLVTRRHLLEWQTAEVSHWALRSNMDPSRAHFLMISGSSVVLLAILSTRGAFWEPAWTPFLLLWIAAPVIRHWIGSQRRAVRKREAVEREDALYLRRVGRETWRFFDDLVGPEHNWLPPDNSQEALRVEVASRTSPTNVGMWLASAVSAYDMGWLDADRLVGRCSATMETLGRLEKCEGHLLNWYNTKTLEPLQPKYVSTVDSGNLIASLWVLARAAEELEDARPLDPSAIRGLADTLAVITSRFRPDHTTATALETLGDLFQKRPSPVETIERIRLAAEPARKLTESLRWSVSETEERAYWFKRLEQEIQDWIAYFDRHLEWVEILAAPPDHFLEPLGEPAIRARRRVLKRLPSWGELVLGGDGVLGTILSARGTPDLSDNLIAWLNDLSAACDRARNGAESLLARARHLAVLSEENADGMNMRFLFDDDRRLFAIGYTVGDPLSFSSHYDLLASEARLSSLVAIAKGDAPPRHWLALGRPYTSSGGQILLSWNGGMFEYLMPLLFTRSFRNSLLENACAAAVRSQIEYAEDRRVPWGVSEAAHSAVDFHKIYQYRAFGVPSLALKRGIEEDLVVAPYASVLALLVDPVESIRNLKRLEKAGVHGRMGFFESLDYTRQSERQGKKGVVVYAYMAHHQGMSLVAINNVLNDGIIRRRFHADRRIKAVEPLLFERVPPQASMLVHRPSDHTAIRPVSEPPSPTSRVLDEDTPVPRVHLLGNGRYSLMLTNAGAGYSRWEQFDITRWRSDPTRDNWGMFFYLKDSESGRVWSATHQPINEKDSRYTATFTADRAEFRRRRTGIDSYVEITVSPEDDAEIRRVTVTNRGLRSRSLGLYSATELSLAPHDADRAHEAFSKLFVRTEALPESRTLVAWRRLRSDDEPPVWVAQSVVDDRDAGGDFEFETDRIRFLGRGRGWRNPTMSVQGTAGFVLDPVFAIKRRIDLDPREERRVTFVTVAGKSREDVLRLIAKYSDSVICNRTFEVAWSHAQLEYRYLGIRSDAAFRFNELASHLLYPNVRMRAPAARLGLNRLDQSKLWAYGISGDLPIAVVSVADAEGLRLVREILVAHTYWRLHGFRVDLVILDREPAGYEQPVHHQLQLLVAAHSLHTGMDQPGGVFLRSANQIPDDALNLILSVAGVTLGRVPGPLSRQLAPVAERALPPLLQVRSAEEQPSAPLPFLELPYFNGLGGFTADGKEYAIYLGPNVWTPLPWINVMANPEFGAYVSESGSGCSWYGNSQSNRMTPWSNDPVSDPPGEAIYIRDEDTGVFWTPTPLPVRELDAYRARHGQGYTVFEHNSHALEHELVTFVPVDADGGDAARVQKLRIRNASWRPRRLSITAYSEFVLGDHRELTRMHIASSWDKDSGVLFARNPYHRTYGGRVAFMTMAPSASSFSGDRSEFLGRHGSPDRPAAMLRESLSNRTGVGFDPCGALQTALELAPGQEKVVVFALGQAADEGEARLLALRYRDPAQVDAALGRTVDWWSGLLSTVEVETPVLSIDLMMNRWLLYQTLSCRIWGRTALYQSSGGYGFRDQLQDGLALLYSAPRITREMILRAASRQFVEGDVQHWWHMPSGEGIRTRCSDDLLWLPYAVSQYVDVTGDDDILETDVPFLDGPVLADGQLEAFFEPEVSPEQSPLFEHCRRAIVRGLTEGPHGLPLIGTGDWNDGMNSVGDEGKGESVWLAWFLVDILKKFAGVAVRYGKPALATEWRRRAETLAATVERSAWDGAWYRRAYCDDQTPLGSRDNPEGSIDSLPQSWSIISGAGDPARSAEAMRAVDRLLIRKREKLVLLNTPPFDEMIPNPGYIRGYPPGVRENGGQYTHAALWVAKAFARMGNGNRAVEVLQMLNPIEHTRTIQDCARYRTEPYAVAADVYSIESQPGRGGWTWYTGSAGWMYRVWLEDVFGFKLRGNRLTIEPVIPEDWPGFTLTFRYGRTEYRIEVKNGGRLVPQEIALEDDGENRTIRIQPEPSLPRVM